MKKSFKKSLAVILATLMLVSVFSVSVFAADYYVYLKAGDYAVEQELVVTLGPVAKNKRVTLPDVTFTRPGYVQDGWATKADGTGTFYSFGTSYRVSKDVTLYPSWEVAKNSVTYKAGTDGVGADVVVEVNIGETTTLLGKTFTRDGYVQVGWTTTDGGDLVYNFNQESPALTESIVLYPVWEKAVYAVQTDVDDINFGFACVGYTAPEAKTFTVKNMGNVDVTFTLPTSANYDLAIVAGSLTLEPSKSITVSVQPKAGFAIGSYKEIFSVADANANVSFEVSFEFTVTDHTFGKYVSNNDATYISDGTKTATCLNKCGAEVTVADVGSMKKYSSDNNAALGLADQYLHHRTVRFTAFGSGSDRIEKEITIGVKRYVPISWYVNDQYNGTFEDGNYDVVFTHDVFGKYDLTINYVEQEYTCNNPSDPLLVCYDCGEILDGDTCGICGNPASEFVCPLCGKTGCGNMFVDSPVLDWVATGETDEKVFEYTVGPTAEEEQEIIMPNTILSLLFGIISYLMDMIGIGNLLA